MAFVLFCRRIYRQYVPNSTVTAAFSLLSVIVLGGSPFLLASLASPKPAVRASGRNAIVAATTPVKKKKQSKQSQKPAAALAPAASKRAALASRSARGSYRLSPGAVRRPGERSATSSLHWGPAGRTNVKVAQQPGQAVAPPQSQSAKAALAAMPDIRAGSIGISSSKSGPIPVLDPNEAAYPRSSIHDFSNLQDAPAGKHGFLTVKGDHFAWTNGRRARFWGINVANTSLQEPDADIDAIIESFRAAGFNLLRLHHFDERGGIIDLDAPDSQHFVAERLRKLDYWIYRAKQAGIYVYLDLLDYRKFKEGDGVANPTGIGRAARPYAVFDRRLIELQKEYALKLLKEHVNPYTGLSYADDSAVVMLEIYDESGLFMRRSVWRSMPEPYATNFKRMWNDWLREQYKSTDALAAAWTDARGNCALLNEESVEDGTVQLPAMTWLPETLPAAERQWSALPRRSDGARFAYQVHKRYFREMREYLRGIGVRVPITATGRFEDLADLKGLSEELDFVGSNFYYDHPYWPANKEAWQPPSFFHNHNPMSDVDDRSMAAAVSLARIKGKPFVVREWNYCWPNRNRASGMVEAACFAALHDIDAMILFVYETRPTARVSYFNVRSDPSRWGLCGVAAQIYLKGLIRPSQHKIVVPYNDVDTFTYTRYHQPFYALGWATRVENDFYSGSHYVVRNGSGNDLILAPGRSGIGTFEGAPAVLHTSSLQRDFAGHTVQIPEYLAEYGLVPRTIGSVNLTFGGILYTSGQQLVRSLGLGLPLSQITSSGYRAIGYNTGSDIANGFIDMQKRRLVFGNLADEDVLRATLDAMSLFHDVPNSHEATEHNVFTTDTEEILRDAASGRLIVSSPQFQALCGNLTNVGRVLVPGLRVRNLSSGTLVALSLDGKPLVDSTRFMVKMVTDARNVDEVSGRDPRTAHLANGQWRLDVLGKGPVTTGGQKSTLPIQISIERRPLLDISMERGSFELLVDGDKWFFYCDTPGVRFALHQPPTAVASATRISPDGMPAGGGPLAGGDSTTGVTTVAGIRAPGNVGAESVKAGAAPFEMHQIMADGSIRWMQSAREGSTTTARFPREAVLVRADVASSS
jgi:hypothetical protein